MNITVGEPQCFSGNCYFLPNTESNFSVVNVNYLNSVVGRNSTVSTFMEQKIFTSVQIQYDNENVINKGFTFFGFTNA